MRSGLRLSTSADVRVHIGLTQQQLANSLGISRSTLALAETGRRPMPASAGPMLLEMLAIAKAMPAPYSGCKRKRKNNRVPSQAALNGLCKKPISYRTSCKIKGLHAAGGALLPFPVQRGPYFQHAFVRPYRMPGTAARMHYTTRQEAQPADLPATGSPCSGDQGAGITGTTGLCEHDAAGEPGAD